MSVATIDDSYVINPLYKKREELVENCTDKKTSQLFGYCYSELKQIRQDNKLADRDIRRIGLLTGGTAIPLTFALGCESLTIAAVFGLLITAVPYLRCAKINNDLVTSYIDNCKSIKCFYNYFEDFKRIPQEIKIKKIFDAFDEVLQDVALIDTLVGYHLMEQEDLILFGSFGKLVIMEALTRQLKEKNENSIIVKQWKETQDFTLSLDLDKTNAEPWNTIGISNPELKYYKAFENLPQEFQFLDFAATISGIFKACVEYSIHKNIL